MIKATQLITLGAAAVVSLAVGVQNANADASALYGTWNGTWAPTEKFILNGIPSGSAPYPVATINLTLHAFDASNHGYGQLFISGAMTGEVTDLAYDGSNVSLMLFYPQEGEPLGHGDAIGVQSGNTISGTMRDFAPAAPGFIHWRGPFTMTLVPEPATAFALLPMLGLARRRR